MSYSNYTYIGTYIWFEKIVNMKSREIYGCKNCETKKYHHHDRVSTFCSVCGSKLENYSESYDDGFDYWKFNDNNQFMSPEWVDGCEPEVTLLLSNMGYHNIDCDIRKGLSEKMMKNSALSFKDEFKDKLKELETMNIDYYIQFGVINYRM